MDKTEYIQCPIINCSFNPVRSLQAICLGIVAFFGEIIPDQLAVGFPLACLPLGLATVAWSPQAVITSCITYLILCISTVTNLSHPILLVALILLATSCKAIKWSILPLKPYLLLSLVVAILLNMQSVRLWNNQQSLVWLVTLDCLLLLLAYSISLNRTIRWRLNSNAAYPPLDESLPTVIATVCGLVATLPLILISIDIQEQLIMGPVLISLLLIVCWTAHYIKSAISASDSDILRAMIGSSSSFSGDASDFIRRKELSKNSETNEGLKNLLTTPISGPILTLQDPKAALCLLDENGNVIFMNRRFKSIFAINEKTPIGKAINSLGIEPSLCNHLTQLGDLARSGGLAIREISVEKDSAIERQFLEVSVGIASALTKSSLDAGPGSVLISARDISDRRRVEEHILKSYKLSALGSSINSIAHSFNDSLTSIAAHCGLANRFSSNEAYLKTSLDEINKAASKASYLVTQLLDFSSSDYEQKEVIDCPMLIKSRSEMFSRLIGPSFPINLQIETNLPQMPIKVNSHLFLEAITALILNSKDAYGKTGGPIDMQISIEEIDDSVANLHPGVSPGNFARIRIIDKGPGMTPDTVAHAFEPLFTTRKKEGHSGLGLTVVYSVVRLSGGFLSIESHPKRGTSISLYFPITSKNCSEQPSATDTTTTRVSTKIDALPPNSKCKILIVEDEKSVRDAIRLVLDSYGFEVQGCADGQTAIEMIKESIPDLLLTDLLIPKKSGLDLLQEVETNYPHLKTIILTGDKTTCRDLCASKAVIFKPFNEHQLLTTIFNTINPLQPVNSEKEENNNLH